MQARQKTSATVEVAHAAASAGSRKGVAFIKSERLRDALVIADQAGLLKGTRTKVVRGRMPEALVNRAKARTGIKKDTDLLEAALASLAVADDFPEWLLSQKGSIKRDIDLEF